MFALETAKNEIKDSSEKKGFDEAVKNRATKTEDDKRKIDAIIKNDNQILIKFSSVFPWDFFPSKIIIESKKVTIIHRQLFSSQVHSVDIKDISNIFMNTSILFSQLIIVSRTTTENEITVNHLWNKDTVFIRKIIEGLRTFTRGGIDTSNYTKEELLKKLKELTTVD